MTEETSIKKFDGLPSGSVHSHQPRKHLNDQYLPFLDELLKVDACILAEDEEHLVLTIRISLFSRTQRIPMAHRSSARVGTCGGLQTWAFMKSCNAPKRRSRISVSSGAPCQASVFNPAKAPRRSPANLVAPPFDDVEVLVRREAEPIAVLLGRKVEHVVDRASSAVSTLPTSSSGSATASRISGIVASA